MNIRKEERESTTHMSEYPKAVAREASNPGPGPGPGPGPVPDAKSEKGRRI